MLIKYQRHRKEILHVVCFRSFDSQAPSSPSVNLQSFQIFLALVLYLVVFPGTALSQTGQDRCVAAPELEILDSEVVVSTPAELKRAVHNANPNTTIILNPGVYRLTATVSVTTDNLTIRGRDTRCDKVVLIGNGMDERNHNGVTSGFWINARNTTIANLTIGEIYNHPIQINGNAEAPRIYNVRMVNAGQQFVKSNPKPSGEGVDFGIVEYSVMEYTDGPPKTDHDGAGTGYTNGIDVHGGRGWQIRRNRFLNFHTPDGSDHEWNAAVLMWQGARDTLTENNLFINVDRAIAYGLGDRGGDHAGGIIRNNLIIMSPGLFSVARQWEADAQILVWDSPGTKVLHNSIVTNGNSPFSIESRFNNTGVVFRNNLADAPIVHSVDKIKREACKFTVLCRDYLSAYAQHNEINAEGAWFLKPEIGDLRLHQRAIPLTRSVPQHPDAVTDYTGRTRPGNATPGAFQTR